MIAVKLPSDPAAEPAEPVVEADTAIVPIDCPSHLIVFYKGSKVFNVLTVNNVEEALKLSKKFCEVDTKYGAAVYELKQCLFEK